ncbi:MAG: hypothetical protein JNN22_03595 [Rhodospirillales bacterium]|nr:hypothetical protein [Rhodospirillales bacterium]
MSAVDQIARDEAGEAMARIDKHEAVCAIRYESLEKRLASGSERMTAISGDIKSVKDDIKAGVWKLIIALFGAVGTLGAALFAALKIG